MTRTTLGYASFGGRLREPYLCMELRLDRLFAGSPALRPASRRRPYPEGTPSEVMNVRFDEMASYFLTDNLPTPIPKGLHFRRWAYGRGPTRTGLLPPRSEVAMQPTNAAARLIELAKEEL